MKSIHGYNIVSTKYGEFTGSNFDEVIYFCHYRYYNEDRELFEYQTSIIMKGKKGFIQYDFGNTFDFKISNSYQIVGFAIDDITKNGWDRKKFHFHDSENDAISGFAEICSIKIPDSLH